MRPPDFIASVLGQYCPISFSLSVIRQAKACRTIPQLAKAKRREKRMTCSSRRDVPPAFAGDLEVKLQCKLHYASTTLGLDLTEVVLRLLGKVEPTSRIANIGSVATVSARPADQWGGANRIQRQIDVTVIRV